MKCPECDGTGKVVYPMMSMNGDEYTGEWEQHECEMCGGTGEMQICEMGFIGKDECDKCHGKGYLTNEEWRKTCSAKEFAKWLEEICFREQYNDGESMSGWYEEHDEKYWKKWLKQPHTNKE